MKIKNDNNDVKLILSKKAFKWDLKFLNMNSLNSYTAEDVKNKTDKKLCNKQRQLDVTFA